MTASVAVVGAFFLSIFVGLGLGSPGVPADGFSSAGFVMCGR